MGVVLLLVGGLLVIATGLLVVQRVRERRKPVLGESIAPLSTSSAQPAAAPAPTVQRPVAADPAPTDGLIAGLHEALADGDLSDEEIQQLLPGAKVERRADDVTVIQHTTSSHRIQAPDGRTYDRVEDIPDPEVREKLRRLLGD